MGKQCRLRAPRLGNHMTKPSDVGATRAPSCGPALGTGKSRITRAELAMLAISGRIHATGFGMTIPTLGKDPHHLSATPMKPLVYQRSPKAPIMTSTCCIEKVAQTHLHALQKRVDVVQLLFI